MKQLITTYVSVNGSTVQTQVDHAGVHLADRRVSISAGGHKNTHWVDLHFDSNRVAFFVRSAEQAELLAAKLKDAFAVLNGEQTEDAA